MSHVMHRRIVRRNYVVMVRRGRSVEELVFDGCTQAEAYREFRSIKATGRAGSGTLLWVAVGRIDQEYSPAA